MKILIVDNDENTVETLKAALTVELGGKIDIVYGGRAALEKIRGGENYDILVVDIMMPEVSGIDVCKVMSQDEKLKKTPVLVISALPVRSDSFRDSLGNFDELSVVKGTLEKPFSINELVVKIKEIVGK